MTEADRSSTALHPRLLLIGLRSGRVLTVSVIWQYCGDLACLQSLQG